jgi:hypothetical protein
LLLRLIEHDIEILMNTAKKLSTNYKLALSKLLQLCDVNYLLLMKLLPSDLLVDTSTEFALMKGNLWYRLTVNEVTRYTALVTFEQFTETESHSDLAVLIHPKMIIRLYHDARMAEVIASQGVRGVKPKNDYPNSQMHLPDEKHQINAFLNEWASLCLQQGRAVIKADHASLTPDSSHPKK